MDQQTPSRLGRIALGGQRSAAAAADLRVAGRCPAAAGRSARAAVLGATAPVPWRSCASSTRARWDATT
jgi:hypothetical protein